MIPSYILISSITIMMYHNVKVKKNLGHLHGFDSLLGCMCFFFCFLTVTLAVTTAAPQKSLF